MMLHPKDFIGNPTIAREMADSATERKHERLFVEEFIKSLVSQFLFGSQFFLKPESGFPVTSKVLTLGTVGKQRQDTVIDSKKMTPAKERNADESKDSRRGVAAYEATVCGEGPRRSIATD